MFGHMKGTADWVLERGDPGGRGLHFYQIDTPGAVGSYPAPAALGTVGWFNPTAGGGTGTVVSADWLNALQGELLNILSAGGVAPVKGTNTQVLTALQNLFGVPAGQCQLQYSNPSALLLMPYGGNLIKVNGKSYAVPSGGIAVANGGVLVSGVSGSLAASTVYLLFVKDNGSGVLVPDFWPLAGGHMPDTTAGNVGVEVRSNGGSPDSTRSYVGMVATNGSSQFSARLTKSWFNRKSQPQTTQFTAVRSTGSTSFVELGAEIENAFLVEAGEAVEDAVQGSVVMNGNNSVTAVGFDGTTPEPGGNAANGPSTVIVAPIGIAGRKTGLAAGLHYATLLGLCSGTSGAASGTASWIYQTGNNTSTSTDSNSGGAGCALTVTVQG